MALPWQHRGYSPSGAITNVQSGLFGTGGSAVATPLLSLITPRERTLPDAQEPTYFASLTISKTVFSTAAAMSSIPESG